MLDLQNLLQMLFQKNAKLSVFKTVRLLREQRWGMVATDDQYEFIYKFMECWISSYLMMNSL